MFEYLSQIDRFLHVLFGITWIGLLYYFNFVGAGYLKEATPEGKKDVLLKLQPNALWYFRWAALFTFLTGLYLLWYLDYKNSYSIGISLGSLMAKIMFLNVILFYQNNLFSKLYVQRYRLTTTLDIYNLNFFPLALCLSRDILTLYY